MNLNLDEIGRFIQACRKDGSMTQAELSERLGVTAQAVSNWERGETLPDVSVLPDLAAALHCSVDAILSGGSGCGGYRRYITVAQMRGALACIQQLGELLGQDHFIYQCVIDALDARMNTTIECAFSDPHIFEVFVGEFLLECVRRGDHVDPRDVTAHLQPCRSREYILRVLREKGIR